MGRSSTKTLGVDFHRHLSPRALESAAGVCERIRLARNAAGLSQTAAASLTAACPWGSLDQSAWSRLETGETMADVITLHIVAFALGVSPAFLAYGEAFGVSPEALLIHEYLRAGNQEAIFRLLRRSFPKLA